MKKRWQLLFLSCLALVLVLSGCSTSVASQDILAYDKSIKTITWGVKADTKLFGLTNIKTGQIEGFDIDIAKALTKKILGKNGKAELVTVTSNTRVPLLKNGNIDAVIATMSITADRKKVIDFSNTYFKAGQSLLVKKGSKIKTVKDLTAGTTVIGVQGSNSVQNIKKYAPKATILQLSDYAQAFTALQSGQGDAMTSDNGILLGMAAENTKYEVVGGNFTSEPYGIGINKGQDKLRKAINKALATIKKDGTYKKLEDKWFGDLAGFEEE